MLAPSNTPRSPSRWSRIRGWRIARADLIVWGEATTFAYLSVPMALWLIGWLHAWLALPLLGFLGWGSWLAWQETFRYFRRPSAGPSVTLSGWSLVAGGAVVALWAFYSGAGGFTRTNLDWEKHFAVLRDLMEQPWPLRYVIDGRPTPLSVYLAYYLPAAGVGAGLGWWSACFTLCLWTIVGSLLAALWFALAVERAPFGSALLFIFASGLDFIGERLTSGGPLPTGDAHIDWWVGYYVLNFPSHQSQLGWAPQHSLAAWMVTGLLATQLPAGRSLGHAGLLCALAALWSPFTLVGLVPFALVMIVRHRGRAILAPANLIGIALTGIIALFLAANSGDLPKNFLWEMAPPNRDWNRVLLSYLLEWGIFYFLSTELIRAQNHTRRWLFWTAGAALLTLPLYRLGIYNDWAMRTTIPALLILWIGVARSITKPAASHERPILLLLVVIGSYSVLTESSRTWHLPESPPPIASIGHVPTFNNDHVMTGQYLGNENTFFFRYLAKPSPALALTWKPANDTPAPPPVATADPATPHIPEESTAGNQQPTSAHPEIPPP